MSAPVMPAVPAPRAPSTGGTPGTGGAESAAPFASALDGALSEGRGAVGDGPTGEEEQPDPGTQAGTVVPGEAGAVESTAAVGLPAVLWALALGAPQTPGQPAAPSAGDAALAVVAPAGGEAIAAGTVPAAAPGGTVPVPAVPPAAAGTPGAAPQQGTGLPFDVVLAGDPGTGAPAAPGTGAAPASAGGTPVPVPVVPAAVAAATAAGTAMTPSAPDGSPPAGGPAPVGGPTALPGTQDASAAGAGSSQDSAGAAPDGGSAEPVTTPVAAGPLTAAPAISDADGATGTAASLPVAGQVARQVAVLRGAPDGSHTMTLVLTPETLGPVEVSVTVSKGTVDLVLRGAHEHGRAALLDALPDLRRDLESAGLTTSRLEVARDSGGSWLDRHAAGQQAQQGSGDRPGQQGPSDGRSRPWLRPADSGETRTVPTTGTSSSVLDVRV